ncbi:MAG TPA: ArsC/Spx/MgsR family protein [Bacillota bacterium]|nr:ArsC/Spx/MgsR family protein [Bacillota bacterium]HPZ22076.1 ArsC/Spx/MgsR family protein [Bacillota bacterium]
MQFKERHIYKQPPSKEELEKMAAVLGHPKAMVAVRGKFFKESGLDLEADSPEKILCALAAQPRLLKRPLLYNEKGALAGFSENEYKEFFKK